MQRLYKAKGTDPNSSEITEHFYQQLNCPQGEETPRLPADLPFTAKETAISIMMNRCMGKVLIREN